MEDAKISKVLIEVWNECLRQEEKWGEQNRGVAEWILILAEEFGEASKDANEVHFRKAPTEAYRKEMIQTAAVAVSAIMSLDRGNR